MAVTDTDVDTNTLEGVEEAVTGGLKNVEIGFELELVFVLVFVLLLVLVLQAFFPTVGEEVDRDPRAGPFLLAKNRKKMCQN